MGTTKRFKHAMVLGKFLPPHKGHVYLIETAAKHADQVTILVCTLKKEPIPGGLRYQWMRELCPGLNVVHVTDEVPSYPYEHPNFWEIWTDLIQRYAPGIDAVFSSEDYGFEIGRRLGIEHVLVDKKRVTVPISATRIRSQPYKYWEFIPEPVRPYYAKRIAILGPESTGKSTLAVQLAEHFNTAYVAEYGREYTDQIDMRRFSLEDIEKIGRGQAIREDLAARKANRILICDTELITTQIWSEIYFKQCPSWVLEENQRRTYDLYLLMNIDIPWVDDGTREFPHLRQFHFDRIKEELENRKIPYHIVSGFGPKRTMCAVRIIQEQLPDAVAPIATAAIVA